MGVNLDYKKLFPGIPTYFEREINGVKYIQGYQDPPSHENDYYNTKEFNPTSNEKYRKKESLNISIHDYKTYAQPSHVPLVNYGSTNTQSYATIPRMTIGPLHASQRNARNNVNLFSTYTSTAHQLPKNIIPSASLSSLQYQSNHQNYSSNIQNTSSNLINLQNLSAFNLRTNNPNISQYPFNYVSNFHQYKQSEGYFAVGGPVFISKQFVDNNSPVQNISQYQFRNYYDNLNRSFEYPNHIQNPRTKSVERDNRKKIKESQVQFELINKPDMLIHKKPSKNENLFSSGQKVKDVTHHEIVDIRNSSKKVTPQIYNPHNSYFQNIVDEDNSPDHDQANEES